MTADKITKRKPFELTAIRDVRMTDDERRSIEDAARKSATAAAALAAALIPPDPARTMAERLETYAASVEAALKEGRLPENVRRAGEAFITANDTRRRCRNGDSSLAAATLADAEGHLQALLAELRRMTERTRGNRASASQRQAVAKQRQAEIERAVLSLPEDARRNAPAALSALKAKGFVPDLGGSETMKVIRRVLRNARGCCC